MPAPRRPHSLCFLPALAALLAAPAALAEEPPAPFGGRGQVALDDIVGLSSYRSPRVIYPIMVPFGVGAMGYGYTGVLGYMHDSQSIKPNEPGGYASEVDMVWFAPSVDAFVRDRLSIGGTIAVSLARGKSTSRDALGRQGTLEGTGYGYTFMPRIGYAIPLGSTFALWPRVAFGYSGSRTDYAGTDKPDYRPWGEKWMGDVELGLVARLHRHVYLNVAPHVSLSVSRAASNLSSQWETGTIAVGATAGFGILLGS